MLEDVSTHALGFYFRQGMIGDVRLDHRICELHGLFRCSAADVQRESFIVLAVIAGAAGSLLGALFWYYVGLWLGGRRLQGWTARHGRWLTLTPEDVDHACAWFNRYGLKAVFFGRLIPAVRTLISVPAGFAKMPLGQFLISSTLGTVLWTGLLAGADFLLESQYRKVADLLNPVSNLVIGVLLLWYAYRVVTFRRKSR